MYCVGRTELQGSFASLGNNFLSGVEGKQLPELGRSADASALHEGVFIGCHQQYIIQFDCGTLIA